MAKSSNRTRLRQALEMADLGFFLMRESLRRRFPEVSESELDAKYAEWITTRPPLGGTDLKVLVGPEAERRFRRADAETVGPSVVLAIKSRRSRQARTQRPKRTP